MSTKNCGGYSAKMLRVDLSSRTIGDEAPTSQEFRRWIGGSGLGTKYLYDEVKPGTEWSDPENRLIIASGPLGGTRISGSGTFTATTKGCMTDLAALSQANGYLGAFLRFNGYEGIVIQGAADDWAYLLIRDGKAELRDASHLVGMDTWQTEDTIHQELGAGQRQISVFGIGPAGENGARFAAIIGDRGHAAAHGGLGAVMGAKRLKAIAVVRGSAQVPVHDPAGLAGLVDPIFEKAKNRGGGSLYQWGTGGSFSPAALSGLLPIKNYATSVFSEHEGMNGQYLRNHFEHKPHPCWACRMACCRMMKVTEGPYTGYEGEEPEYEGLAGLGSQLGMTDAGAVVMLCNECDRVGLDINEAGWVLGLAMECYEKGIITKSDLGGLDLTWGNAEAARSLLWMIGRREGLGDVLAEGVRRGVERIGGEAPNIGVYTLKGAAPRSHDHRGRWPEMLDTCTTNTSTIEATFGGYQSERLGLPPARDLFSPEEVSRLNAQINGWHQFDDCLGVCRLAVTDGPLTVAALNAATGWDITMEEAMTIGRRIVNQLRVFNLEHGLRPELERPSLRYGSTPVDGPAQGIGIAQHWDYMIRNYREHMGWDPETGKPLPETLTKVGLDHLIPKIW